MNKHLFVIFLSLLSSSACASDQQLYFDYPGQSGFLPPLSPDKPIKFVNSANLLDFPSQVSTTFSPSSSNSSTPGSTPEQARKADITMDIEKRMAALALLQNAKKQESQQ